MTKQTASASVLFARAAKAPAPESTSNVDRSRPVTDVSSLFAEVFNETQARQGRATADVAEMASVLEDYAVKAVRAEMVALAKSLTARAKSLTAEDIRVLGNVSGSQVTLSVPGLASGDAATSDRNGGDRSAGTASVRFTPDPRGVIGTALRDLRVSPRAVKVVKPAPTA